MNTFGYKILEGFADKLVTEIKKEILKQNKTASKRLFKSIDYRVDIANGGVNILLFGEPYFVWVDQGRKKGSYPNIKAIKRWVNIKGFAWKDKKSGKPMSKDTMTFLISRAIAENGIDPTNILDIAIQNVYKNNKMNMVFYNLIQSEIDAMLVNLRGGK